jgi:hypothetical protein
VSLHNCRLTHQCTQIPVDPSLTFLNSTSLRRMQMCCLPIRYRENQSLPSYLNKKVTRVSTLELIFIKSYEVIKNSLRKHFFFHASPFSDKQLVGMFVLMIYETQNSEVKFLIKFCTTTSCSPLFGLFVFTMQKYQPKRLGFFFVRGLPE